MNDTREILRRGLGDYEPPADGYERVLGRRDRRRRNQKIMAGALAAAIVIAGALAFAGALRSEPTPMDDDIDQTNTRPLFQRTTAIGGAVRVTSPSDWYLIDYWGDWNSETASLESNEMPLLELTNFDPGLSEPVCGAEPGGATRLPANGIAILVTVGNDGRDVGDLCGGSIEVSSAGTVGATPYSSVMTVGPEATEADRTDAQDIWNSIAWIREPSFNVRERGVRYVLDGGEEGSSTWLLEAQPSKQNVKISLLTIKPGEVGDGSVEDPEVPQPNAIEGDTFGAVTQEAVRVEFRIAGVDAPLVARLIDLPASLNASFDAWVVEPQPEPQPTGGTYEGVALGADGEILGSTLPPLVDTELVGTVRAFGTNWAVKRSTAADGYWAASCVEPAATASALTPCERGPGGGKSVQRFDEPGPAVFVTQPVGDIDAIDLRADDGRVFPAVMLPVGRGRFVAVIALEGRGRGRFVYYFDGRIDRGRTYVEWPDLGQVIGEGSFLPAD